MTGSLSAINTNPIGTFGLDVGNGYGNYGDPMMTGMMSGMGGMYGGIGSPYGIGMTSPYGMGMMGGLGMMGMMSPQYIQQMGQVNQALLQLQNQNEVAQLNHANDMHKLVQNAEVQNLSIHERTVFEKAMTNADIKNGIRNLCDVIRSGDQDAICEEYDKLKQYIFTNFADYFEANAAKKDVQSSVNDVISSLYTQILSTQAGGEICDLRTDIKNYGETPFAHGFNSYFLGNSGHNKKYTEETLSYLYGTRINDKGLKTRAQNGGKITAAITEGAGSLAVGAAGGSVLYGLAKLLTPQTIGGGKLLTKAASKWNWASKLGTSVNLASKLPKWGKWAAAGAAAVFVADLIWQNTRD